MSLILCIETGTDICSVALSEDGSLVSLRESSEDRNHAQNLALFVEEMFRGSSTDMDDLDAVAVSMGPGSYTGLRIGVSLAKGICYALNKPLIAVGSLDSMLRCALQDIEEDVLPDVSADAVLAPMIDARRMEVYTQIFDQAAVPLSEVRAVVVDKDTFDQYKDREFVIFGNGAKKCMDILSGSMNRLKYYEVFPSARGLVKTSYDKFLKGDFVDVAYFEPLYLKNFIATKPKHNPLDKKR